MLQEATSDTSLDEEVVAFHAFHVVATMLKESFENGQVFSQDVNKNVKENEVN